MMYSIALSGLLLLISSSYALPTLPGSIAESTLQARSPVYAGVSKVSLPTDGTKVKLWFSSDLKKGAPAHGAPSSYQCFGGDVQKLPSLSKWMSFNELYKLNKPILLQKNSADIVQYIHDSIIDVSKESNVDARLIFAMMMQESWGNANVPCTSGTTYRNCGLLQAAAGSHSFDPSNPQDSIKQMIEEGITGTSSAPGLVQYLNNDSSYAYTNNKWTGNPFAAARVYNSGHIEPSGNLDQAGPGTTSHYVNDIANRLLGWDGSNTGCAQVKCGLIDPSECKSWS